MTDVNLLVFVVDQSNGSHYYLMKKCIFIYIYIFFFLFNLRAKYPFISLGNVHGNSPKVEITLFIFSRLLYALQFSYF